jgi:hypothetical protein
MADRKKRDRSKYNAARRERRAGKKGPALTVLRTETIEIVTMLPHKERAVAGLALAATLDERAAHEAHAETVRHELKEAKSAIDERIEHAKRIVQTGEDVRQVDVRVCADFAAGTAVSLRVDNGEPVGKPRKLRDDERQTVIAGTEASAETKAAADDLAAEGTIPTSDGKAWSPSQKLRATWSGMGFDVQGELRAARAWIEEDPENRRKPSGGMARWMSNYIASKANRSASEKPKPDDAVEGDA